MTQSRRSEAADALSRLRESECKEAGKVCLHNRGPLAARLPEKRAAGFVSPISLQIMAAQGHAQVGLRGGGRGTKPLGPRKQATALTGVSGCPKNTRARCLDPDRKTPVAERAAARWERGAQAAQAPQSRGSSVSHVRAPARLPDKMEASIDPNSRETRPVGGKYAGGEEPCDRF